MPKNWWKMPKLKKSNATFSGIFKQCAVVEKYLKMSHKIGIFAPKVVILSVDFNDDFLERKLQYKCMYW